MKAFLFICIIFLTGVALFSCKKPHTTPVTPPLSPEVAENYFTAGPWVFSTYISGIHPPIYDSVAFFFNKRISATRYVDSIAAYYPLRLVIFTYGTFIISNSYNTPDTLISPFSPYTASGAQIDTFLIKDLSARLFIIQRYSATPPAGYPAQQDTLRRN